MGIVQEGGPLAGSGRKEDIGAAIQYAVQNSGALISAVRALVGFFGALFAKKRAALLGEERCPFCGR